jgi:hypothetical protein
VKSTTTKLHPKKESILQTPKERHRLGQERRKQVAREIHAKWKPAANRKSPVDLIAASMRGRLPRLITLKYKRMMSSPFGFFRGAVPVCGIAGSRCRTPAS